jgi:ABC-2 type transporter
VRGKRASRTLALIGHNVTLLLREPGPLASRLVMPLIAIAVFEPLDRAAIGSRGGPVQAVTGMLVLFSMLSLSVVGGSVLAERVWRTWDRLRATSATPLELLAGKALPVGTVLAFQQTAVLSFGILVAGLHVSNVVLVALVVGVWSIALLAIGTALSLVARSSAEFSAEQLRRVLGGTRHWQLHRYEPRRRSGAAHRDAILGAAHCPGLARLLGHGGVARRDRWGPGRGLALRGCPGGHRCQRRLRGGVAAQAHGRPFDAALRWTD